MASSFAQAIDKYLEVLVSMAYKTDLNERVAQAFDPKGTARKWVPSSCSVRRAGTTSACSGAASRRSISKRDPGQPSFPWPNRAMQTAGLTSNLVQAAYDGGGWPRLLILGAPARKWVPRPSCSVRRAGTTSACSGAASAARSRNEILVQPSFPLAEPGNADRWADKQLGTGSIVPALAKSARTGHPEFQNGKEKHGKSGPPAWA